MKASNQNLKTLIELADDIYQDDSTSLRFTFDTDEFSQTKALRFLNIKAKDLENDFISSWCFDDGFIHITILNSNLELLGYDLNEFELS